MRVAEGERDAAPAARDERAEEVAPEVSVSAAPTVEADDLAAAGLMDGLRDDRTRRPGGCRPAPASGGAAQRLARRATARWRGRTQACDGGPGIRPGSDVPCSPMMPPPGQSVSVFE